MHVEEGTFHPIDEVLEERKTILGHLRAIEVLAQGALERRDGWHEAIQQQLDSLSDELRFHFYREETGGVYSDIRLRSPHRARALGRLRQEHLEILAQAEVIANAVREHTHDAPSDAIADHVHLLGQMVRRHEEAENELMRCAYADDGDGAC